MWLTFGCFDLAPLVLKLCGPNLMPAEILIIIIIDTMIEKDWPVAIRYDALEPTYIQALTLLGTLLSSLLHCLRASLPSPPRAPPLRGRRLGALCVNPPPSRGGDLELERGVNARHVEYVYESRDSHVQGRGVAIYD